MNRVLIDILLGQSFNLCHRPCPFVGRLSVTSSSRNCEHEIIERPPIGSRPRLLALHLPPDSRLPLIFSLVILHILGVRTTDFSAPHTSIRSETMRSTRTTGTRGCAQVTGCAGSVVTFIKTKGSIHREKDEPSRGHQWRSGCHFFFVTPGLRALQLAALA